MAEWRIGPARRRRRGEPRREAGLFSLDRFASRKEKRSAGMRPASVIGGSIAGPWRGIRGWKALACDVSLRNRRSRPLPAATGPQSSLPNRLRRPPSPTHSAAGFLVAWLSPRFWYYSAVRLLPRHCFPLRLRL